MHHAAQLKNFEILSLLLENGANPNAVDHFGQTPFSLAQQYPEALKLLHKAAEEELSSSFEKFSL